MEKQVQKSGSSQEGGPSLPLLCFTLLGSIVLVVSCFWLFSSGLLSERPPELEFQEVTQAAGIDFVHNNGASSDDLLPESMGSGVAFFDCDRDGDQDLLFVNSTYWPWEGKNFERDTTLALYINDGYGSFRDGTKEFGLAVSLYGMGVAVGDYDNDGWVDVFVTAVGENRLFRNIGGKQFTDVSTSAGVSGIANDWSSSAAWVDFDRDGLLDLFVCNYVRWPRELGIEMSFKLAGIGHGYGPQVNFTGTFPYLYLNNGDGTFREVARDNGFELIDPDTGFPLARSLAVAPVDVDNDGWLDLVIANHDRENFLFRNVKDGRFEEASGSLEALGANSQSMGIDAVRLENEGLLGEGVGSFANEFSKYYQSLGDELIFSEGIGAEDNEAALQRFGMFFFDCDLDGRLDMLAVNGYLERRINQLEEGRDFRRSAQLFWNGGARMERRFVPIAEEAGNRDLFQPVVGRGAAFADFNGDGALDFVITQNGGRPLLLQSRSGGENNWVRIQLVGTESNRDAIGAEVELRIGNRSLSRRVMPTRSYLSQSESLLTFGLGKAWKVREAIVRWPNGLVERFETIPLRELVVLVEGQGVAPGREELAARAPR
ncbi:CRTAC1 family protein [Pelagicoccus sp. SDUM812002]|uniref:CRTAC1 family protein n=1 Tax=Pelagicoccus sp. SDUM812002 TaxID=3041266 RepID=UPI00280F1909|nr:CRTAC1 family protein [Pelagicoccus sp. SDUM812002]MDQ8186501.1 CRTAC1 family protein [Pelagicoccus sp. SDUM812002]